MTGMKRSHSQGAHDDQGHIVLLGAVGGPLIAARGESVADLVDIAPAIRHQDKSITRHH